MSRIGDAKLTCAYCENALLLCKHVVAIRPHGLAIKFSG